MPNTTVTLVRLFFKTYLRCPPRIFYGTVPIGQTSTGFRIKALNAQDDDTGAAAQNRRLHFFLLVLSANGQETDDRITILEGISATDAWRLLNCWIPTAAAPSTYYGSVNTDTLEISYWLCTTVVVASHGWPDVSLLDGCPTDESPAISWTHERYNHNGQIYDGKAFLKDERVLFHQYNPSIKWHAGVVEASEPSWRELVFLE